MEFKNKKVLVVGLGALGGGVATVQWLLAHGAQVVVTDLKTREQLRDSIRALKKDSKKIRFVLGRHNEKDFVSCDVIVVNPAVRIRGNKFLALARKKNIPILNDLCIFLDKVENPVIAVTGTRGKTTTTNWIAHFLSKKYPGVRASGNSSDDALLKLLPRLEKNKSMPAVLELSSFQLELAGSVKRAPDIAMITNLYRDHLNRHNSMKEYARAKANIFGNQEKNQVFILNIDNEWSKFFSKIPHLGKLYVVSTKKRKVKDGIIFTASGEVLFFEDNIKKVVFKKQETKVLRMLGVHNIYNFLFAALAAWKMGIQWEEIRAHTKTLPVVKYRQEIVLKKKNLTVINDTTATSPEGAIVGIERFGGKYTILIAGGTDKKLEYAQWARVVKKYIIPNNLFLLEGSATKKMIRELRKINYFKKEKILIFENLEMLLCDIKNILLTAHARSSNTILFSPGAASFEKFKNEFDRGERFNALIKKIF